MWIIRINAACDLRGIPYHRFINGLRKAKVDLNRKALAELALSEPKAFDELVETAKKALAAAQPAAPAKK
jgi:large subunit ribosomal protein L20